MGEVRFGLEPRSHFNEDPRGSSILGPHTPFVGLRTQTNKSSLLSRFIPTPPPKELLYDPIGIKRRCVVIERESRYILTSMSWQACLFTGVA